MSATVIRLDEERENRTGAVKEARKEIRSVPIKALIDHPDMRPRPAGQQGSLTGLVTAYEEAPADMPPIQVAVVDDGLRGQIPYILDGRRRIEAAKRAGLAEIRAEVRYGLSFGEAALEAQLANLGNSLQLNDRARRQAARKALKLIVSTRQHLYRAKDPFSGEGAWAAHSLKQLAERLRSVVHVRTIRNWMQADSPKAYAKWWSGEDRPFCAVDDEGDDAGQPTSPALTAREQQWLENVRAMGRADPAKRPALRSFMEEIIGEWAPADGQGVEGALKGDLGRPDGEGLDEF